MCHLRLHPLSPPYSVQTAEVENHMTSVERMIAYTQLDQVRLN